MKSELLTFSYPDGEIQRVQAVRPERWSDLEFLRPEPSEGAFEGFYKIYKQFLVPAAPWAFGNIVMFRLPEGVDVPYGRQSGRFGAVADPLTAAAVGLRRGVAPAASVYAHPTRADTERIAQKRLDVLY